MQCPACKSHLMIGTVIYTTEDGVIYCNQPMICTNPQCTLHGGSDLSKPTQVVETVKHKLN